MLIDFRLLDVFVELDSLKDFLNSIQEQESYLSKVRWEQLLDELKSSGYENNETEWDIATQRYNYQTQHIYPKALRGAFIVSLWATFESSLNDISRFVQRNKGIGLSYSDIRGANYIDQMKKYFSHVISFELSIPDEKWRELEVIYLIRNCFAHANGRIEALKQNDKEKLFKVKRTTNDIYEMNGYVHLEKIYLKNSFDMIDNELRRIIKQVRDWHDILKANQ